MKIGVLTTFYNWDRAYSLVSVVEGQLNSLLRNGYQPVLFVHDNFNDDSEIPEGVDFQEQNMPAGNGLEEMDVEKDENEGEGDFEEEGAKG